MGGSNSKPWRDVKEVHWDEQETMDSFMKYVKEYRPLKGTEMEENYLEDINILLLGPMGAGKSSFMNTISSTIKQYIHKVATVEPAAYKSTTRKFSKNYIALESREKLKFSLCDCRGLESSMQIDDYLDIIDGHVQNKYTLEENSTIKKTDRLYNANPRFADKMHVVVFVFNGRNEANCLADETVIQLFRKIKEEVNNRDIPYLVLMSHVDGIHKEVSDDVSKVYCCEAVHDRLAKIASALQVSEFNILPMVNYVNECKLVLNKDILALYNMKRILQSADTYLTRCQEDIIRENVLPSPWTDIDLSEEQFEKERSEIENYGHSKVPFVNVLLHGSNADQTDFLNETFKVIHHRDSAYDFTSNATRRDGKICQYQNVKKRDKTELYLHFNGCTEFDNSSVEGMHCVVHFIPATKSLNEVMKKYKPLAETLKEHEIPQLVIVTNVEDLHGILKDEPYNTFHSRIVKKKIEEISDIMSLRIVLPNLRQKSFSRTSLVCLVLQNIRLAMDDYLEHVPSE